jgi:cytochrome c peroxidase
MPRCLILLSARLLQPALILLALQAALAHPDPLVDLGRALFFDPNLSEPPGQACATCHDPARAFSDPRGSLAGALSVGADGHSLGERNTPALTYIAFVPVFGRAAGHYQGGLFLDGRAATLAEQAIEPMLNPLEMAMPDKAAIARRVLAEPAYRQALQQLFGAQVVTLENATLAGITAAIAAFERSAAFSTFDSRYDRYLSGNYEMTRAEAIGREVFFSGLVNCIQCHLNNPDQVSERETFTNHRYHNIGTPKNPAINGQPDPGLGGHLENPAEAGKFRVPSLRNVAVTAPYMHNGVFADLETAVAFYAKYTLRNQHNPDTGEPWQPAAIEETVDLEILVDGQPIDPARIHHLTAFLKTLTDRRYEHLLD